MLSVLFQSYNHILIFIIDVFKENESSLLLITL